MTARFVFTSALVNSFVSRMTQKYSTDFQKIRCKGPRKKPWDVNGNPDHDILKLG